MRFHPVHLLPDVSFQIVKGVKLRGRSGGGPHLGCQLLFEFSLPHSQQTAVSMVDDDELLRVQQVMGNDQRADRVIRCDSAGIADHVRIPWLQSQAAFEQDSGIHAGQDSQMPPWADGQVSQVEVSYKLLVGLQQFVGD